MPSPTIEAKRNNFRLAIERVAPVRIRPGEVFSFWRAVGAPTRANGFREGRTIIDGQLQPSVGGGLCQVSGLLYAVSLRGGLTILERHNHSVDIYTEATRYTPLGSDATVAYGYKDLRLRNDTDGVLSFRFTLTEDTITVHLNSTVPIRERDVIYQITDATNSAVSVITFADGQQQEVSHYRKLPTPELIQDYDPNWENQFDAIRVVLQKCLADLPVEIEHVGSTAVPGLAAKAIIDLDIIYPPSVSLHEITNRLSTLGYQHFGDQGIPDREVYKWKGSSNHPVLDQIRHHLYACPEGSEELNRHLVFRDLLRTRPDYRQEYQRLKRALAERANQDKKTYARLKETGARTFIERLLKEAEP